jgi:hypothetical protein
MGDVIDYVELDILNFRDMLCRDRVQVFGNDFPKSDPEELRVVKTFTNCVLHRFCESASLTVGIIPHFRFECFVIMRIGTARRRGIRPSPIFSCPLSGANTTAAAILNPLKGKEWRIKKNQRIFGINAVNAPHFACRHGGYAQLHLSAWCSAAPKTSAADSLPGRYV